MLLPAGAGVALALVADATAPSLALLLAEPLLWMAFSLGAAAALFRGRPALAIATLAGWILFAGLVRWPVEPRNPPSAPRRLSDSVRACTARLTSPAGPLSIATWSAESALAPALAALGTDVVVVTRAREAEVRRAAEAAGYAALHVPEGPGVAILARDATFRPCRDERARDGHAERWTVPLPGRGIAAVAVPELPGAGAVPIVAVWFDRPQGVTELAGHAEHLQQSAARTAGLVAALGSPAAVVAGDTATHGTFRHLLGWMASPPLLAAPGQPTWPARIGVVPTLPLYHADRVWYGPAWRLTGTRVVRVGGTHLAYVAELAPASSH